MLDGLREGAYVFKGKHLHCPICALRMVRTNHDMEGVCPEHGQMGSADHLIHGHLSPLERLIEIRARQALYEIGVMADEARDAIYRTPRYCNECLARWHRQGFI